MDCIYIPYLVLLEPNQYIGWVKQPADIIHSQKYRYLFADMRYILQYLFIVG